MSLPPFDTVVRQHGGVVLRVCRAVLPPADADDAWSTTFLAALEAYPRLTPDSNVRGWLVTIAHRKAIDVARAAARAPSPVDDRSRTASAATHRAPGADAFIESHDGDLWNAVRRLPVKQRHAVAYHHVGGLPYVDVGELLGCSTEAARRSASDGISSLRRTLTRKPVDP